MNVAPCVLIAEDDEGHATLIRRNLQRAGLGERSVYLKDGQELLDDVYKRAVQPARGERCRGDHGGPEHAAAEHMHLAKPVTLQVLTTALADLRSRPSR